MDNKKSEPLTAENLIKYLQEFPGDSQLFITTVAHRGKKTYGYPIKQMHMITDAGHPHFFLELGKPEEVKR